MSKLEETMRTMHALLRGEKTPEEVAEIFGTDPKRLAVYQRFSRNHMSDSLDRVYKIFRSLIPIKIWNELKNEYFKKHPANSWRMNTCAREFVDFTATKIKQGLLDSQIFYIELLQFEWEDIVVYSSKNIIPKSESIKTPILNPTLSILNFEYPVASFTSKWRKEKNKKTISKSDYQKEKEMVFIYRHPKSLNSHFLITTDSWLFAFKIVHDNIDVTTAAKLSGESEDTIRTVMKQAQEAGFIILPNHF